MNQTVTLNPTQMHLLKLFSFNDSEDYAREIQSVLTKHFQQLLDQEADRLWDEGILNQQKLDEIRHEDLRRQYETSLKEYWDYTSTMDTAYRKGERIGRAEGVRSVALNLKKNGVPVDVISSSTGLSTEEIEKL